MPRPTYQLTALLQPVLVPLLVGAGLDEVLEFHHLELASAEDEVAGGDLVAEALAHLGDTERRLTPRRIHDRQEVREDPLGCFRAEIVQPLVGLDRTEIGLEQAVEHPRLGELALDAAVRAVDVGQAVLRQLPVLGLIRLLELVGPEPVMAVVALGQRVDEGIDVAGGDPHLARKNDRGVDADDVLARLHRRTPPLAADVLLELDAQRPVVPG